MGGTTSTPVQQLPQPAPPAPLASVAPISAIVANNQPTLFNMRTTNINSEGESIYNNSSSNSGILIDSANLKKCMILSNSDTYSQNNCVANYVKGIDNQNQLTNLTQANYLESFVNIKGIDHFQYENDSLNIQVRNIIIIVFIFILILLLCKK
jgi:hypothetical protein